MLFNHGTLNVSGGVLLAGGTTTIASDLVSNAILNVSGGTNTVGAGASVTTSLLNFVTGPGPVIVSVSSSTSNLSARPDQCELGRDSGCRVTDGWSRDGFSVFQRIGGTPGILDLSGDSSLPITVSGPATTLTVSAALTHGGINLSGGEHWI